MRAVVDTNVLLSGLLWRGTPHELIELARSGATTLISSSALLDEFSNVIRRPKFRGILDQSNIDADHLVDALHQLVEKLDPPPLPDTVSRDIDDDDVLALAVAARADLIISGDADLLVLGAYDGISIVDAATAMTMI